MNGQCHVFIIFIPIRHHPHHHQFHIVCYTIYAHSVAALGGDESGNMGAVFGAVQWTHHIVIPIKPVCNVFVIVFHDLCPVIHRWRVFGFEGHFLSFYIFIQVGNGIGIFLIRINTDHFDTGEVSKLGFTRRFCLWLKFFQFFTGILFTAHFFAQYFIVAFDGFGSHFYKHQFYLLV